MLDRQTFVLSAPHKCRFLPFDVEQVAHHLSLCLLACIMRQHASAKVLSRIKEAFTLVNDEYKIAAALICEYG